MGHMTRHYTFELNKSRKAIEAIANEDAIYENDSRSELPSHIRFLEDKVYEDIDAAEKAIEKLDSGWYDQLAVQFYHYEQKKETKAIINLRERIETKKKELIEYKESNSVKNRKSEFIGCPKCKSKINKEYIKHYRWNQCPLCWADLSSKTLKEAIANKINQIDKMTEQLNKAIKDNNQKGEKSIKWLVKTEYHV